MKKKGISPLIATVLIIGFTVALAAIIITWSTGFTKKMQTSTEETANVQVICATDVIFDIKSVCKTADGDFKVLIQNDGKEPITGWKLRAYEDVNTVKALDKTIPINAFGIDTITITKSELGIGEEGGLTEVTKIEAFPIITRSNKDIICSQNTDSYGDAGGSAITTAC